MICEKSLKLFDPKKRMTPVSKSVLASVVVEVVAVVSGQSAVSPDYHQFVPFQTLEKFGFASVYSRESDNRVF